MHTGSFRDSGGLRTEGLGKHFSRGADGKRRLRFPGRRRGEPVRAVEDVSLEVSPGTVLGLLGRNGAGKTTLVKLLATLIEPTSGDAWVSGHSVRHEGRRVRGCVGLAAGTERGFYFRLTGTQNLSFFATLHGISRSVLAKRMSEALERLELTRSANDLFMRYSTGTRRKLDLARALILDTPVLLLDEPTSSLDPSSADRIRTVIAEERRRGKTVVLVTHNLLEAERLCDRVAILDQGRLRAEGTLDELRGGQSGRTVEATVLGDEVALERLVAALGALPGTRGVMRDLSTIRILLADREALNPVLDALAASRLRVTSVVARDMALEEIFREITDHGEVANSRGAGVAGTSSEEAPATARSEADLREGGRP
jgi:ABC-2 type transport system ATP-binding protein